MDIKSAAALCGMTLLAACGGGTAISGSATGNASSGASSSASSTSSSGGSSSGVASSGGTTSATGGSGTTGGTPCASGRIWVGDECVAPSCAGAAVGSTCQLGDGGLGECAGGTCRQLRVESDPRNCGFLGLTCPSGSICVGGACTDPLAGQPLCGGGANCGTGQTCTSTPSGVCVLASCDASSEGLACALASSATGFGACCGGSCIDDALDAKNCGGCGAVCNGDCYYGYCQPFAPTCDDGHNGQVCPGADGGNSSLCCFGQCVDLENSPDQCVTCGYRCPLGSVCSPEGCVVPDAGIGGDCEQTGCAADSSCQQGGFICVATTCGADSDNTACVGAAGDSRTCCGGACINRNNDPQNCGRCGNACVSGEVCVNGGCEQQSGCAQGSSCSLGAGKNGTCCSGSCVDLNADGKNCGACETSCVTGAFCEFVKFEGWFCYLDDAGTPGYCLADSDCPVGDTCVASGMCVPAACGGGSEECPLDAGDSIQVGACCGSACVNLYEDQGSCGGCGQICPGTSACINGLCSDPASGSPVGCGSGCPQGLGCVMGPQGEGICVPSTCGPGSDSLPCAFGPGLAGLCCGGSCVNNQSDPANCAQCGFTCSGGYCDLGRCVQPGVIACELSCQPEEICGSDRCLSGNCEGAGATCAAADATQGICCANGACAHPLDDASNCGSCGIACPGGQTCVDGVCSGSRACGPGRAGGYCNADAGSSWLCCAGTGCTNTANDSQNCGNCATVCPSGTTCRSGACG